jgi:hypothetical protein
MPKRVAASRCLPWRVRIARPALAPWDALHPLSTACMWTIVAARGTDDPNDCGIALVEVRAPSLHEAVVLFRSARR